MASRQASAEGVALPGGQPRGPWTSGGIELNFGIVGHTPTTATPVNCPIHKNADGGLSCVGGALDLPSRTYRRVKFTIPPGKAYVEAQWLWYNPRLATE